MGYDPDQPRDADGKWGAGGSGGASGGPAPRESAVKTLSNPPKVFMFKKG